MAPLSEFFNLREQLIGLLGQCLDHNCPETKRQSSRGDGEDVFYLLNKKTRDEMMSITGEIYGLLGQAKPLEGPFAENGTDVPPDASIFQVIDINNPIHRAWLEQRKKIENLEAENVEFQRKLRLKDKEKLQVVVEYYKDSNPTEHVTKFAKKFNLTPKSFINALRDNGVRIEPRNFKNPVCALSNAKGKVSTPFKSLSEEMQKQLTDESALWTVSGKHRLNIDKKNDPKTNIIKIFDEDQRKDMFEFFLKYRDIVHHAWIIPQIAKKYKVANPTITRILVQCLNGDMKGEKPFVERRNHRYRKLAGREEMILNYVKSHKPEDISVRKIIRVFELKIDEHSMSKFLKDNGVKVYNNIELRAMKLAQKGLEYTRAVDPEKAARYYKTYQERKKQRKQAGTMVPIGEGGEPVPKRQRTKKTGTKAQKAAAKAAAAAASVSAEAIPAPNASNIVTITQAWGTQDPQQYETDHAIATLTHQAATGAAAHQAAYVARTTRSNNQYYYYTHPY